MSDFNFYLNRVGVRGPKGEQGEQGFSPIITVATNTLSEYILQIQTQNNTFLTANLREHKDDLGGTYIRYNRETGVMYAGEADTATTQNLGEVRFATATELERNDGSTVVTPADVNTLINAKGYDAAIEAVDDKADANADNIATNTGNISTLQGQMTGVLGNYVTTDTAQTIPGAKAFNNITAGNIYTNYITTKNGLEVDIHNSGSYQVLYIDTDPMTHNINYMGIGTQRAKLRLLTAGNDVEIKRNAGTFTNLDSGNISNYLPDMNDYYTSAQTDLLLSEKANISDLPTVPTKTSDLTNDSGFITSSDLPAVGNGTITFTQGGTTKGTITTNQSGDTTIALDAGGGASYTAGNGIDITNDEISVDDTVVALQSDIPDISNMVTTDTAQAISGTKTFNNVSVSNMLSLTRNSGAVLQLGTSLVLDNQTRYKTITAPMVDSTAGGTSGGAVLSVKTSGDGISSFSTELSVGNNTHASLILKSLSDISIIRGSNTYTNLDSGNISTNAYIQALEARIAALEANINGGNA